MQSQPAEEGDVEVCVSAAQWLERAASNSFLLPASDFLTERECTFLVCDPRTRGVRATLQRLFGSAGPLEAAAMRDKLAAVPYDLLQGVKAELVAAAQDACAAVFQNAVVDSFVAPLLGSFPSSVPEGARGAGSNLEALFRSPAVLSFAVDSKLFLDGLQCLASGATLPPPPGTSEIASAVRGFWGGARFDRSFVILDMVTRLAPKTRAACSQLYGDLAARRASEVEFAAKVSGWAAPPRFPLPPCRGADPEAVDRRARALSVLAASLGFGARLPVASLGDLWSESLMPHDVPPPAVPEPRAAPAGSPPLTASPRIEAADVSPSTRARPAKARRKGQAAKGSKRMEETRLRQESVRDMIQAALRQPYPAGTPAQVVSATDALVFACLDAVRPAVAPSNRMLAMVGRRMALVVQVKDPKTDPAALPKMARQLERFCEDIKKRL